VQTPSKCDKREVSGTNKSKEGILPDLFRQQLALQPKASKHMVRSTVPMGTIPIL